MIKTTCLGCGQNIKDCVCHSPDKWNTTTLPPWETGTGDTTFPTTGEPCFEYDEELAETIKQIKNRCDAVLWLLENPDAFYVLPTLLGDIYEDAQLIVEDFCIDD